MPSLCPVYSYLSGKSEKALTASPYGGAARSLWAVPQHPGLTPIKESNVQNAGTAPVSFSSRTARHGGSRVSHL